MTNRENLVLPPCSDRFQHFQIPLCKSTNTQDVRLLISSFQVVYANDGRLMSPWPCPPDNRVRDFNGLANPLPCLSARGHAFTGCTEVRIADGVGQGGVTAVRAPLWGVRSEHCIRAGRHGLKGGDALGRKEEGNDLRSVLPE